MLWIKIFLEPYDIKKYLTSHIFVRIDVLKNFIYQNYFIKNFEIKRVNHQLIKILSQKFLSIYNTGCLKKPYFSKIRLYDKIFEFSNPIGENPTHISLIHTNSLTGVINRHSFPISCASQFFCNSKFKDSLRIPSQTHQSTDFNKILFRKNGHFSSKRGFRILEVVLAL
jgi:hypothetical protein